MDRSNLAQLYTFRVTKLEVFANIARNTQLQLKAREDLIRFAQEIAEIKVAAVSSRDEALANMCLGCECAITSLVGEIAMWLLLKDDRPDEAWDHLIEAQNSAQAATRADSGFLHLIKRCRYLLDIERTIFPPQVFTSAGLIVGGLTCKICGSEYGECDHVLGHPYMGEFCAVQVRGPYEPDHVAFVDIPEDKRCRVTSFGVEGGQRNRMTWIVTPSKDGKDESHTAQMIILHAN